MAEKDQRTWFENTDYNVGVDTSGRATHAQRYLQSRGDERKEQKIIGKNGS